MPDKKIDIGIALSGGGVRAAAFHSGVLKYLAEKNKLEFIKHISSVSGGSLFTGLVFCLNDNKWPTSDEYRLKVFPDMKKIFISTSLQFRALCSLIFNPKNWRFLLSRANVISNTIEKIWKINCRLKDLPEIPIWSINGTTAENGHRFRVKGKELGDYELGYAEAPDYKLTNAMAMSAAFPLLIGPLSLKIKKFKWHKKKDWTSDEEIPNYSPTFNKIHLYDGGVYDNLGIEPFFDTGEQIIKANAKINMIFVSDASNPFTDQPLPHPLNPFRAKRFISIIISQIRALRVRSFVNFIIKNPKVGSYFQMGVNPEIKIKEYQRSNIKAAKKLLEYQWQSNEKIEIASKYKTTLKQMKECEFEIISRHGYEMAKWNIELFNPNFVLDK